MVGCCPLTHHLGGACGQQRCAWTLCACGRKAGNSMYQWQHGGVAQLGKEIYPGSLLLEPRIEQNPWLIDRGCPVLEISRVTFGGNTPKQSAWGHHSQSSTVKLSMMRGQRTICICLGMLSPWPERLASVLFSGTLALAQSEKCPSNGEGQPTENLSQWGRVRRFEVRIRHWSLGLGLKLTICSVLLLVGVGVQQAKCTKPSRSMGKPNHIFKRV